MATNTTNDSTLRSIMKPIIVILLIAIAIVLVSDFYVTTVQPAYFLSVNQNKFVNLAVECNVAVSILEGSNYNSLEAGSKMSNQANKSNYVTFVVCHEFDLLAAKMLSHGVNTYKLRELYIQSLENERLPLWLLAEPPMYRWERQ